MDGLFILSKNPLRWFFDNNKEDYVAAAAALGGETGGRLNSAPVEKLLIFIDKVLRKVPACPEK